MIDHYSTLGVGKNANADDIKKAFSEYQELKRVCDKMKIELESKRTAYSSIENESDKKQLSEAIADMEMRLIRMMQLISEKETFIRNAENKVLMSN